MENENKIFRIKHRDSAIIAVVLGTIFALFMLIVAIARFSASLRGETVDWRNSWWITVLFSGMIVFTTLRELRNVFLQLTLSKEGIWYHQLGSKRFIPWEQVEGVDFVRAFLTKKKQYYLMLNSELNEDQKTFLGMKQDYDIIPLWVFADRWLGSELRDEIKRLNPSLPMQ